jgi:hypothetical protein
MTAAYGSSKTTSSKSLTTYAVPFEPQMAYLPPTIPTYTRPSDWVSMPTIVTGDKKIAILYAVWNDTSNFVALSVTGSAGYTVDWGDGTSPVNYASGVQAEYNYSYSTVSSSVTTRGYKTVVATITPQSSGTLTGLNTNLRNSTNTNTSTGAGAAASPMLEMTLCSAALTSWTLGSGTPTVRHSYVEKITVIDIGTLTTVNSLFNNCHSLQSITAFSLGSSTDMSSMFQNCYKLSSIPLFNTASITLMNNTFQGCDILVYVPDLNTSNVTAMGSCFQDCRALVNAPNLDTSAVTNFGSMYANCSALYNVPTIKMAASGLTTLASMFSGCSVVKTINILHTSTATGVAANSAFTLCYCLVNPPTLDYSKFNNVASMYNACASIVRFPNKVFDFSNIVSLSNGTSTFNSCYNLTWIDTIKCPAGSSSGFGTTAFVNCYRLIGIGTITGGFYLNTSFQNCYSLTTLPTIRPESSTATNCFNSCYSLQTITLDWTDLPSGPTMNAFFQSCYSLKSVTMLNATGFAGPLSSMFQDCRSLETIPTLPSTSTCQTFTSMFQNCYNLRVAPSLNLASATNTTSMFAQCYSLQTVPAYTFPSTGSVNITGMFTNCYSLESVATQAYGASTTLTTGGTTYSTCPNLSSLRSSNLKVSFSIANAKFSGTQLDQVYTDLPTVSAQTITVTNNWGTATDTPTIATGKGWTVTGT